MAEDQTTPLPPVSPQPSGSAAAEYGEAQIKYLTDREHVRHAAGMYIGDKSGRGMHHLVYELVANSIDEAMAGFCKEIRVTINGDGSITVADDGRGIPVGRHEQVSEKEGRDVSTLEAVMTMLHVGGKFDKQAYKSSGGLHGIGIKAVNFLSEWCEVEVRRDGHVYHQEYSRGAPTGPVSRIGSSPRTGTKITFKVDPSPDFFGNLKFDYNILQKYLREMAFLNRGVKMVLQDQRTSDHDTFQYDEGLVAFVKYLNRASEPVHPEVVYIRSVTEEAEVEVALQYSGEYTENVHTFVNNINTEMGGTHLAGFRVALTRTLNSYGKKNVFKESDITPIGEDFREGLTAVISVRLAHPQFESQTKVRVLNAELEGLVSNVVGEQLANYLEENPKTAKKILEKALLAAEAREAAKKAKQLARERKGLHTGGSLPGKLRDCLSSEVERCELYLVEGDSAGGSAEGGRLREFQAILPLRGKIINAYKSREDKVLSNEEIRSMISAIGCGIGEDQDLAKRRYDKIVIMTDADVDGSHIRTLLLTFFYRQMYSLVHEGHVYIAQPPLFRVKKKKDTYYVQTDEEMKQQLLDLGLADAVLLSDGSEKGGVKKIAGDRMARLCRTLAALEESVVALERRGISLRAHAARRDEATGLLPIYHVFHGSEERWFSTRAHLDEYVAQQEADAGEELAVDDSHENGGHEGLGSGGSGRPSSDSQSPAPSPQPPGPNGHAGNGQPTRKLRIIELNEVRSINNRLAELTALGFDIQSLIPQHRTGIQEPRYRVERGESVTPLDDLRGLPGAIRAAGEKGLTITRFKGLGEMNAEELRDTTLDPANRTLVQVTMADGGAAEEMFRTLMGDKVEPRREYIEKHALEVRNLDV
jgi:DNA gyrase subunit B